DAGVDGLAARAGVVTGTVAVTVGAAGEGMVAGDAVNTAARVQAAADAGTVLVDEGTWQVVQAAVGFVSAGAHALKGKAEPLSLWRAERVLSGVGGAQRIESRRCPRSVPKQDLYKRGGGRDDRQRSRTHRATVGGGAVGGQRTGRSSALRRP
ncbi:MAG: hypothetical protein H0T17_05655, partial [Propionibacteriales bacterium]|nr:hypothetical protein [Propionibacteriales bacterium]